MKWNIKEIQEAAKKCELSDEKLISLLAALPKQNKNRKFSFDQYKKMSIRFNKMTFADRVKTIQENSDLFTLAADGNWWGVKIKDKEIEELFDENDLQFEIEREWSSREMYGLIFLLEMELTSDI